MTVQMVRRPFTVAEYHDMAAAGILSEDNRVELIDGEVVQMSRARPQRTSPRSFGQLHGHSTVFRAPLAAPLAMGVVRLLRAGG